MDDHSPPPDWRLPRGVSRGLWDYLHNPAIARSYDADLAESSLLRVDLAFAEEWLQPSGRLIDLGCGTGRLLIPFAQKGYRVLGVDLAEEMLHLAGEKAARVGVSVDRLRANLLELDGIRDGTFDYAACLFSTLGMVVGTAERRKVVAHAHRLLRPGGRFVLHVHNRWFNVWNPSGRRWLLKNWFGSLLGRETAGDHIMPIHQGVAGLVLHLFTGTEAARLLREMGFRLLEVRPVSLRPDGRVPWSRCLGWLRAYGYLIAAERVE